MKSENANDDGRFLLLSENGRKQDKNLTFVEIGKYVPYLKICLFAGYSLKKNTTQVCEFKHFDLQLHLSISGQLTS